jgi:hypothetical protein
MSSNQVALESENILFRIWLYRSNSRMNGVIDLMRRLPNDLIYIDALEAEFTEDKYDMLRLVPRGRGKDIPSKWFPLIEMNLLAPVSTKVIHPYRGHVFGEGSLYKMADIKYGFWELELQDVSIISPLEFRIRSGAMFGDDCPNQYDTPPTSPTPYPTSPPTTSE